MYRKKEKHLLKGRGILYGIQFARERPKANVFTREQSLYLCQNKSGRE